MGNGLQYTVYAVVFLGFFLSPAGLTGQKLWKELSRSEVTVQRKNFPSHFSLFELKEPLLEEQLVKLDRSDSPVLLTLPRPDGTYERFRVQETFLFPEKLARKYPSIRTFSGKGMDDPSALLRMEYTPKGLHGMVLSGTGTYFIDPYGLERSPFYLVYFKKDYPPAVPGLCSVPQIETEVRGGPDTPFHFIGEELHTYRLAVAATGEYTRFHGGTKEAALAAIVTTINRVGAILERDMAIRLVLVEQNDDIVFTDPADDPYTLSRITQNQIALDDLIGERNYDIGHLFDIGNFGRAEVGSVCVSGKKARGYSASSSPAGDPFDIDLVAHEIGHQFGAHHTFNNCLGQQGEKPFEPGSGSTIMSWSGLCGSENIAANNDPYFHSASVEEMTFYVRAGEGSTCGTVLPSGNMPPVVAVLSEKKVIPVSTPFELTGSAQDAESDPLTYTWEQIDAGPLTPIGQPEGNAPLFRSVLPAAEPVRIFPRLENLLNGIQSQAEVLPFYPRDLTFRFTARDQRGGVAWADQQLGVTSQAGPFFITAPNQPVFWTSGTVQTVIWEVAQTDRPPVNAVTVDIFLSLDGGFTFPVQLARNTPNDGMEQVFIPRDLASDTCRIKVKASDHVFFDINDADFVLQMMPTGTSVPSEDLFRMMVFPNPVSDRAVVSFLLPQPEPVVLEFISLAGQVMWTFSAGRSGEGPQQLEIETGRWPVGVYGVRLRGIESGYVVTKEIVLAGKR